MEEQKKTVIPMEGQPIAQPLWAFKVCRIKDGVVHQGRDVIMDKSWYVIGRRFLLDRKVFDGERKELNDSIRSVSRENAYLIVKEDKIYVQYYQEQGHSKALIRINGWQLEEGRSYALKPGDVIRLGNTLDGDRERCVEFTMYRLAEAAGTDGAQAPQVQPQV